MHPLVTMIASDLRQRLRDRSLLIFGLLVPLALMTALNFVIGGAWEPEVEDVTEIQFETVTERTADLYRGQSKVAQEGVPGALTTVSRLVLVDGVEESRRVLSEAVTAEPVPRRVLEGTAARPVVTAGPVVEGDVWGQLAQCESGGNPSIVSSNGLYYGLYQFSLGTWQAMGGSGLPSDASVEEQTQRAQALQARSGWGQWPACARKLGLR